MRRISFLISILLVFAAHAAADDLLRVEERRIVMGVECHLTMYVAEEETARHAARDVFARLELIEQAISSWRPASEASILAQKSNQPVPLSPVLFDLLWRSLEWAERSGGAFDPTLGPLSGIWRKARDSGSLPASSDIAESLKRCGWDRVSLNLAKRTATLSLEGMGFDFGGIGKGYAADQALHVLRAKGIFVALVSIGGDMVAGDPPPGRASWRVDVPTLPVDDSQILSIASGAVATSGDLEQFIEVDGVRYSHIFDPRDGEALTSQSQVTAIVRGGDSPGADADALASAASVLASDSQALKELLKGLPGSELIVVTATGEGKDVSRYGPSPLGVIRPGSSLDVVFSGGRFTEGPAANAAGDVYFTDQPNDRIMVIRTSGKVDVAVSPSGRANGLAFDQAGNLWACADLNNELWKISENGDHESVRGPSGTPPFNGPNDVWIAPDQTVYFTDPYYQRPYWSDPSKRRESEAVYQLDPKSGAVVCVAADFVRPNGIIGSPDGTVVYVSDIGKGVTWSFPMNEDGTLGERIQLCSRGSDGMTVDDAGNIYLTGDGVHVYDSSGQLIEWIQIPEKWTSNVCIGGKNGDTLFITAMGRVYSVPLAYRRAVSS